MFSLLHNTQVQREDRSLALKLRFILTIKNVSVYAFLQLGPDFIVYIVFLAG